MEDSRGAGETRSQPNADEVLEQAARHLGSGSEFMPYPQNDLDGFQQGAKLDLRARISLDLLKSAFSNEALVSLLAPQQDGSYIHPDVIGVKVCDVAESVVSKFERRGWIKSVSESGDLSRALRTQAERMGAFHAAQQIAAHKEGQEAQARVATLNGVGPVGRA